MVSRLSSFLTPKRHSLEDTRPPPPYEHTEHRSPVFVAEQTTTTTEVVTTTTTRTTTHFFAVPYWRKRVRSQDPHSPRASLPSMVQQRCRSVYVDKELPPTPPDDDGPPLASTSQRDVLRETAGGTKTPAQLLTPDVSISTARTPLHSSTATLVQAALGIGLPHGLGQKSSSASASQINTLAFGQSNAQIPTPRRIKSSSKLRALSTAVGEVDGTRIDERRRSRGLSLGASNLLNMSSDPKGKAKATETEAESPRKSLSRRASFWTRKKATPDLPTPPNPPSPNPTILFAPLPSLNPGTPFFVDLQRTASPPSSPASNKPSPHIRGLSRSRSERALSSHRLSAEPSVILSPPPLRNRRSRRPATADSPDYHQNNSSLFVDTPLSPIISGQATLQAAPQQRPRANTNPPLLHRLSLSLFSGPSLQLPSHDPFNSSHAPSPAISQQSSPRPSLNNNSKTATSAPKPRDNETPEQFIERLRAAVSKAEIASVLASSSDDFHVQALHAYMAQFDFKPDPLDVALRRFLMDVGLPRETQQIDRVMEAFAARYVACHPTLFSSEDHPYVIAFSLIMLHTDAFNKSNKRKMTKADYVKNTQLPGVYPQVLDCFYDNIVFAPFIFVEDPLEVTGPVPTGMSTPVPQNSVIFGRGNKVDLYYLISNNMLDSLRIDVESIIPISNPFSWNGLNGWDDYKLQEAFAKPTVIPLTAENSRTSAPFFSMTMPTGPPGLVGLPEPSPPGNELWTVRATKIGLLSRKEECLAGGRRATTRKWRSFNVVLTESHLLFSRDVTWAQNRVQNSGTGNSSSSERFSPATFKSDEVASLRDVIAVTDASYTKHRHTFRLVLGDGRQYLLQADDDDEADDWVGHINYASTFKSVGVRMRPMRMSGRDVELTGVAAATSHLHDLQHANQSTPIRKWGTSALMGRLSDDLEPAGETLRKVTVTDDKVPTAPEVEGADQFKATFDEIKAELAAGRWGAEELSMTVDLDSQLSSFTDSGTTSSISESHLPSRSHIVQSRIHDLDSRVSELQSQLDADLRFVRNIAILAPFQRQTRERLTLSVQNVAKRVMQERLDIVRLSCHRAILARDLSAEGRDWNRAKQIALKAATETLQNQLPHDSTVVPRMTLSFPKERSTSASLTLEPPTSAHRPESTCESFHSALDFELEISDDDNAQSSSFTSPDIVESPRVLTTSNSSSSYPFPDLDDSIDDTPHDLTSPRNSDDLRIHEKFYTAQETEEEAEEWNKTRCAQRVSLVRLPSTIGIRVARENGQLV